jgi:hypothetical protein
MREMNRKKKRDGSEEERNREVENLNILYGSYDYPRELS